MYSVSYYKIRALLALSVLVLMVDGTSGTQGILYSGIVYLQWVEQVCESSLMGESTEVKF